MEEDKNTLNNQSSSFSSPPSDMLSFGSSSPAQSTVTSQQNNSFNNNNTFIQSVPSNIEDMPVTAISDFSTGTIINNNINQQTNPMSVNSNGVNLISGLQESSQFQQPQQVSPNTVNETSRQNKFVVFGGSSNYNDNSYSNQNNANYNPFGLQSVVQNTINQNNNVNPVQNSAPISNDNNLIGPRETVNNQAMQNSNSFRPLNNLQQGNRAYESPASDLSTLTIQQGDRNDSESLTMNVQKLMQETLSPKIELEKKTKKENKLFFGLSLASGAVFAAILLFAIFGKVDIFNFSIQEVYYENKNAAAGGTYTTAVVTDNKWKVDFDSNKDQKEQSIEYIKQDSQNQKDKCGNDSVKKIETEIEEKYGIVAVNFCELDYRFATEIKKVIETIYNEFPMIKSQLTNLTLQNMQDENGRALSGILASFKSASLFAKSTSLTGYPQIYKMSIFLNANSFLNPSFNEDVKLLSSGGFFVSGATRSSIVAHEFGHYLSFLAQLNNSTMQDFMPITRKNFRSYSKIIRDSDEGVFSKKILEEAMQNAMKKGHTYYDLFEFRSSISEYAASTPKGVPLYDETIAEAFHDYYLNKKNAKFESLEIMEVLKKYLNN